MEERIIARFAILPVHTSDGWVWLRCYVVKQFYSNDYDPIALLLGIVKEEKTMSWYNYSKHKRL